MGAITDHIDDILRRGEPDMLSETRASLGHRFRTLRAQKKSFARGGAGLSEENDFSKKLNQEAFAKNLKPLHASPELWASRQRPLPPYGIKLRQRELGKLRRLAPLSRPDICAKLARIVSRVNSLRDSEIYRIRGEKIHCGTRAGREQIHRGATSLIGRSDAAHGSQSGEEKCQLGHVKGLMSSTLKGPCHTLQWISIFTRQLVRGDLGGEVYA